MSLTPDMNNRIHLSIVMCKHERPYHRICVHIVYLLDDLMFVREQSIDRYDQKLSYDLSYTSIQKNQNQSYTV